jgi:hypothetical protein
MTSHNMTSLETQLSTLDPDTAQRVLHLVFECNASLDLALLAVQDANQSLSKERRRLSYRHKGAGIIAALWAR